MKLSGTLLLLLAGAILGSAATTGFHHWRRAEAIRALPALADRNHPPLIDEISFVKFP
jgi:hypothetical protein